MENLPAEVKNLMTEDLLKAFNEVQMARPPYVLEHFVVKQHDTLEQQYAQCVVELQIKYDNIRRAILGREKLKLEQELLAKKAKELKGWFGAVTNESRQKEIEAQMKQIDVEEQDRAFLGALREFTALYAIFQTFPKKYTRDDLNQAQPEYWQKRLTRQANQDVMATGRIGQGNADSLRMIGLSPVPEMDHVRSTEQNYLKLADVKILLSVPTEKKAEKGLLCLEGIVFPSGAQVKLFNVHGRKIADAYNETVLEALRDGANFIFTVEDDTFPPPDALKKLYDYCRNNPKTIWGGWYPKRQEVREGTPIVIANDASGKPKRQPLEADGQIHECYTIPMGCTLFPIEVFLQTTHPWFATTEHLTQDSFFSQLARDSGWKLMCDTGIRCRHIDRVTGKVYV